MLHTIAQLLRVRGINTVAPLSLAHCTITRPYLLDRVGIRSGTAFLFAVPYYTTSCADGARNISSYAVSADYHRYFNALFDEILPLLRERFPTECFAGFTDHSPIAEAEAAVRAGLGFFGCNHLFLTTRYSSYVFLGEIITSAEMETPKGEIRTCPACGACKAACPVSLDVTQCLSALTQKRGELTTDEQRTLLAHGCAWGCDRCQEACPITAKAIQSGSIYTPIPFFQNTAVPQLTAEGVRAMSEEEFAARAYSWRGRQTILRNLQLLEKGELG